MKTTKPVYLDDGRKARLRKLLINLAVAAAAFVFGVAYLSHRFQAFDSQKEETCNLLAIAFDEAQMAPGWYESAGKALQACGKDIDKEDILRKVCYANRWNGYESEECSAFEKERQ